MYYGQTLTYYQVRDIKGTPQTAEGILNFHIHQSGGKTISGYKNLLEALESVNTEIKTTQATHKPGSGASSIYVQLQLDKLYCIVNLYNNVVYRYQDTLNIACHNRYMRLLNGCKKPNRNDLQFIESIQSQLSSATQSSYLAIAMALNYEVTKEDITIAKRRINGV